MFFELTTEEELRTWLPRLVGIEGAVEFRIGSVLTPVVVRSVPEAEPPGQPDPEETTSAVHYVRFPFTADQIEAFAAGPAALAVNHPAYPDGLPGTSLGQATRAELLADLRGE